MNITFEPRSDYSPYGAMAFSASWQDDTHRYHVWLGLRENDKETGEPVPYPVAIEPTIYKNKRDDIGDERARFAPTIRMDLNAKAHAKIKAEIKRLAKRETLLAMFEARKAEHIAFDAMRADADRLNAIFDAVRLLNNSDFSELQMMKSHASRFGAATKE